MNTTISKLKESKILNREELKKVTGGQQAAFPICCEWQQIDGVETCTHWIWTPNEQCP